MKKVSIVTGGGSGIGRAITLNLAASGYHVLIVGRRIQKLEQTKSTFPEKIDMLKADISDIDDRKKIVSYISDNIIEFLVHNAAILGEITSLENMAVDEWKKVMAVNVDGPLFLTQALLSNMDNTRILHISSGAAHHAIKGWSAYCTTKAALYMIYQMQNKEYRDRGILTASLRPGIVDTEMQSLIRKADIKQNPHLKRFHDLYNNNELESCERVAKMVSWILTKTTDEQFIEKEFDIRDEDILHLWDK